MGNTVSVIDLNLNSVTHTINVGNSPTAVAITPDSTRAYVTNLNSNNVSVIDSGTNTVINTISINSSRPTNIAITPDGTRPYVTTSEGDSTGKLIVINIETNTIIETLNFDSAIFRIAIGTVCEEE